MEKSLPLPIPQISEAWGRPGNVDREEAEKLLRRVATGTSWQEKIEKSINFLKEIKIKNLKLYFDDSIRLAKTFSLRGLPTSIIINKNGEEIARVVGSIDFTDEEFTKWLSNLN